MPMAIVIVNPQNPDYFGMGFFSLVNSRVAGQTRGAAIRVVQVRPASHALVTETISSTSVL